MTIETYKVTLKHDKDKIQLTVVSLSGEQGAKNRIMSAQRCPECSIINIKKIS